jgi:hypothetical protein
VSAHREAGWVELLAEVLRDSPKLEDAACVGRWPGLFDPPGQGESLDHPDVAHRRGIAVSICRACPCLEMCREWAESQPQGRLSGVVAGEIRRLQPMDEAKRKKPRRPKPKPMPAAVPA